MDVYGKGIPVKEEKTQHVVKALGRHAFGIRESGIE